MNIKHNNNIFGTTSTVFTGIQEDGRNVIKNFLYGTQTVIEFDSIDVQSVTGEGVVSTNDLMKGVKLSFDIIMNGSSYSGYTYDFFSVGIFNPSTNNGLCLKIRATGAGNYYWYNQTGIYSLINKIYYPLDVYGGTFEPYRFYPNTIIRNRYRLEFSYIPPVNGNTKEVCFASILPLIYDDVNNKYIIGKSNNNENGLVDNPFYETDTPIVWNDLNDIKPFFIMNPTPFNNQNVSIWWALAGFRITPIL